MRLRKSTRTTDATHCMLQGNPKGATERLAAFFSHHEVTATDRARRPKPTDARPLPRSRRRKSGSNMRKSICRLTSRVLRFHQMNHRVLSMCGLALSLFGDEKGCWAAALEPRRRPGAVHRRVDTVHMCTDVNDVAGQEYPLFQRVFLGLVPNVQPSRAAHPTDATPDGRSSHRQRRSHRSRDGLPESYIRHCDGSNRCNCIQSCCPPASSVTFDA